MQEQQRAYSIFVSSHTDSELIELRDIALQSSWDEGHAAHALISSVAHSDSRKEIQRANVFVRLCRELDSSTREECLWAGESRIPTILLVVGSGLDGAIAETVKDFAANSVVRAVSSNPYVFARDYLLALHPVVRRLDRDGAPHGRTDGSEPFIFNPFWRRFAARINQWTALDWRFNTNAVLKRAAAEFFFDRYLDSMRKGVRRLFFESGSACAYASQVWCERVPEPMFKEWNNLECETNNIISHLELSLSRVPRVRMFPDGPPERKYGATFGSLVNAKLPPGFSYHPLTDEAYEVMMVYRNHFREQYTGFGLLLAATSGIDLSHNDEFAGPHCSSYRNMLFKRSLLESGAPIALFLDEDKLPRPAIPQQCIPVCDSDFSWYSVCRNIPLALVCSFRSEERARKVIPELQYAGLDHLECGRQGEVPWTLIASNALFQEKVTEWTDAEEQEREHRARRLDRSGGVR